MDNIIKRKLTVGALVGLVAAAFLFFGGPVDRAGAHTSVKRVAASTKVLRIAFSGPIRRGSIRATNSRGRKVSRGRGSRDSNNASKLKVRLKNVKRGRTYFASWKIVAVDGHKQSGTVSFRVR